MQGLHSQWSDLLIASEVKLSVLAYAACWWLMERIASSPLFLQV